MKFVLVFLLVLTAVSFVGFFWWTRQLAPVNPADKNEYSFIIVPNQSASSTVDQLNTRKFIRSPLVAKLYLKLSGLDKHILPGNYLLSPSTDMKNLLTSLTYGPRDIWVTIPEGWRREQIATRMAANLQGFSTTDFNFKTASLEGRLFPDTYLIPTYATASDIIKIMSDTFNQKVGQLDKQTLVLASLVEREVRSDADRPIVAGILLKRLQAGWPLQVDATIQYAANHDPDWWAPVTNTKLPTFYNTYLHLGLPPSPICNPGLASINAARHPQNSPYWYYLHDSSGKIHYAKTLEEHNANVDKYLSF